MRELETWVAELRAHAGGVRWTFGCEDCLPLCAALAPRQFDVVATADVADHVGLLPLLQAARLVTRQGVTLLTSTRTYLTYSDTLDEYLTSHLFLEPALWPGVLGWRCIGREGPLKPLSSQIQLSAANAEGLSFKSQVRNSSSPDREWSEGNLIWTRAEPTNLPLDASKGELATLVRACQLSVMHLPFGSPFVPPLKMHTDGVSRLHLHSLLPVLAAAVGSDRLLKPADREISDLLAFWRGELQDGLVVASILVSEAAIEATTEPQPHLAVLLETRKHGTLVYSALWLSCETGERRVCRLVDPDLLVGATAKLVGGIPLGRPLAQSTQLQGEPCPEPSAALFAGLCRPTVDGWPGLSRAESSDATRLVVCLTDEWWRRLEAG
jgi:hypothetical protein